MSTNKSKTKISHYKKNFCDSNREKFKRWRVLFVIKHKTSVVKLTNNNGNHNANDGSGTPCSGRDRDGKC